MATRYLLESGSSSPMHPWYWAEKSYHSNWTLLRDHAKHFKSRDAAKAMARRHGLKDPRIRVYDDSLSSRSASR